MALNRRQFFGSFWGPDSRRMAERKSRCESLEGYAWTNLVPFDFSLNPDQSKHLGDAIRAYLSRTSDDDLFSSGMARRLEEFVGGIVEPWRSDYFRQNPE
jgi:hypothetical protein